MKLHRFDVDLEKYEHFKTKNAYVYAPVNMKTGEVDTEQVKEFEDEFDDELGQDWEFMKLYLSLEEPK